MPLRDPFDCIAVPQPLVCEFFGVFSRFEFALKDCGFVRDQGGYAAPAWRSFAAKLADWLVIPQDSNLDVAVKLLITTPPQVQLANLKWADKELVGIARAAKAVEAATRVRNNLFHGGKHAPYSPPGRDEQLIKAALILLYSCLEQNDDLRMSYETTHF